MAIDSKPLPSKEDAIEFVKLVDSSKSKTNALREDLLLDCDEEVRNKVINHNTYEWIRSHRKFDKVIQRLRDKGLTGEYPPQLEIEIAYCIARILHMYIIFKSHPESIRRTTEACATKALKNVKELQLLLDTELQMENFMDSVELRILLDKLNLELSGEATTTYMKSRQGDVLGRKLVAGFYQLIIRVLGEAPAFVVSESISIMHPVSEQSARRYIKNLSVKS